MSICYLCRFSSCIEWFIRKKRFVTFFEHIYAATEISKANVIRSNIVIEYISLFVYYNEQTAFVENIVQGKIGSEDVVVYFLIILGK